MGTVKLTRLASLEAADGAKYLADSKICRAGSLTAASLQVAWLRATWPLCNRLAALHNCLAAYMSLRGSFHSSAAGHAPAQRCSATSKTLPATPCRATSAHQPAVCDSS